MDKSAGKKWPWIIFISTIAVIAAAVITVKLALKNPDEASDYAMQNYHEYDKNINEIIEAKIAFDKLYTIAYQGEQLNEKGSVIRYLVTDKEGKGINNAKVDVVLTRPNTVKLNISLENPTIENGVYTFKAVDLPKPGRWDIMAKVTIDANVRYFNLKADTRNNSTFEF